MAQQTPIPGENPDAGNPPEIKHISQVMEETMAEILLDREKPLIKVAERYRDGTISVNWYERHADGRYRFVYDCHVRSIQDGMQWITHMAEKRWVTVKHLRIFAQKLLDTFAGGRR